MARIRLAWAFIHAFLFSPSAWLDTSSGRLLPQIAGADDDADDDDGDDDDSADDDADDDEDDDEDEDSDDDEEDEDDERKGDDKKKKKRVPWRRESRKHERRAKKQKERADRLEEENRQLKAASGKGKEKKKSGDDDGGDDEDVDAKIEKARLEEREAAAEERKQDRLEAAIARRAKKFADSDDALLRVQRAITSGDIDEDELFNERDRVDTEALDDVLKDILKANPHLKSGAGRATGDSDAGKGKSGGKSDEDMSVEDHLKAIQKSPK